MKTTMHREKANETPESKLNEFKTTHQPKGLRLSKLDPHIALIANLHHDNYSLEQICEFLKLINIVVHYTTISRFIKRRGISKESEDIFTGKNLHNVGHSSGSNNSGDKKSKTGLHIERPQHQKFEYNPAVMPDSSKGEKDE